MGNGFSEAALAVFTTLAPMGAGAFLIVAAAIFCAKPEGETLARLDKFTALPLAVVLAGFVGAFFHLASPLNALGVFAGVGASPLSNEIAAAMVFVLVAVVYFALAVAGKLSDGARRGLVAVAAVLALVFMAFCGMAYMMDTIPSWNLPASVVQMLGYGLLGGAALGALTLGLARVDAKPVAGAVLAVGLVGLVLGAAGFAWQIVACGDMANIWGTAASLVPAIWPMFGAFAVCAAAAVALLFASKGKGFAPALPAAAVALVAVGIFVARIGFYGLYMSVAL